MVNYGNNIGGVEMSRETLRVRCSVCGKWVGISLGHTTISGRDLEMCVNKDNAVFVYYRV